MRKNRKKRPSKLPHCEEAATSIVVDRFLRSGSGLITANAAEDLKAESLTKLAPSTKSVPNREENDETLQLIPKLINLEDRNKVLEAAADEDKLLGVVWFVVFVVIVCIDIEQKEEDLVEVAHGLEVGFRTAMIGRDDE